MLLREATSEIYGPGVYSHHINLHHFIIALLFTFTFYVASLYQKYQKYYLSSLSDLTLVSDHEGIDNPNRVGCVELFVLCRYEGLTHSLLLG